MEVPIKRAMIDGVSHPAWMLLGGDSGIRVVFPNGSNPLAHLEHFH